MVQGGCKCNQNYYGDGVDCTACPSGQSSGRGSKLLSDCYIPYAYVQVKLQFDNKSPEDVNTTAVLQVMVSLLFIGEEFITVSKEAVSVERRYMQKRTLISIQVEAATIELATATQNRLKTILQNNVLSTAVQDIGLPSPKVTQEPQISTMNKLNSGMPMGFLIGIILGSVVGLCLLVGISWYLVLKLLKKNDLPALQPVSGSLVNVPLEAEPQQPNNAMAKLDIDIAT